MTVKQDSKPAANVKFMAPTNRLKQMTNRSDGIRVSEAIQRAEAKVEEYKSTGLSAMDASIAEMQAVAQRFRDRAMVTDLRKLYLLSNDIFAAAGQFGEPELSEAAYSLCDLISNRPQDTLPDWEAINVHVASMHLLRQTSAKSDPAARQAVLAGLKKVTARLTADKP